MIRIEAHHTNGPSSDDVTGQVKRASVTLSLTEPWQTIQLDVRRRANGASVDLGDYVTVSDDHRLLGCGIVAGAGESHLGGAAVTRSPATLEAIFPLAYLGQTDAGMVVGRAARGGAGLLTFSEWKQVQDILVDARSDTAPGKALARLVASPLGRMEMPRAIATSGDFRSWMRVAYDADSGRELAPGVSIDPVIGSATEFASPLESDIAGMTSPLSGMLAIVRADPRLVETFPVVSMERSGAISATLVYRFRPWLSGKKSLVQWADKHLGGPQFSGETAAESRTTYLDLASQWARSTWDQARAWDVPASDVIRVTMERALRDAWTATHIRTPGFAQPGFYEDNGFPLRGKRAKAGALGHRIMRIEWPLMRYGTSALGYAYALAALAAHFHLGASRFRSGSVELAYTPGALPGTVVTIPTSDPGGSLTGYVESVTHSLTAMGRGSVRRRTTLRVTRALFADREDQRDNPVVTA